ncbi:MAG: hemolysin family protein [Spirochaetes bacterium]|nr:hemolysin family protein [Spirochaetota bacterium]
MVESYFDYAILGICLFLSAFFSGTETAFFSLRKWDLFRFLQSRKKSENYVAQLMQKPQHILVTILLGNLFVNLASSALATKILLNKFQNYGHLISIAVMTPLVIVFCEIVPKLISMHNNMTVSRLVVMPVRFFHAFLFPLRMMLVSIMNIFSTVFRIDDNRWDSITAEELDMAIRLGEIEGILNKGEGNFIKNVLRFSKKEALNVMIPRIQAHFIPAHASIKEAIEIFQRTGAVRLPVFEGDIDNIIGVIDVRELLPFAKGYKKASGIKRFIKSIVHYPGTKKLDELLVDFLRRKIQIAIVMDEYGGTAGVVTLGTILSEIIGHEYVWEDGRKIELRITREKTTVISGDMQIDDFNAQFGDEIESIESETVGGFIAEKLERLPRKGDEIATQRHRLIVKSIKKNRAGKIEVVAR